MSLACHGSMLESGSLTSCSWSDWGAGLGWDSPSYSPTSSHSVVFCVAGFSQFSSSYTFRTSWVRSFQWSLGLNEPRFYTEGSYKRAIRAARVRHEARRAWCFLDESQPCTEWDHRSSTPWSRLYKGTSYLESPFMKLDCLVASKLSKHRVDPDDSEDKYKGQCFNAGCIAPHLEGCQALWRLRGKFDRWVAR